MRRPIGRLLLTLIASASMLGVVPTTSEAGIIPWAWDTMFGPVGSIQARHAARYGYYGDAGYSAGCCYGPAPRLVGFRGWRNNACCGTTYGSYYGGYGGSCYGGACSSCGGCDTGCSSCSTCSSGYCGVDGGYAYGYGNCGPGGCANGTCNANYPPAGSNNSNSGPAPVTPAAPRPAAPPMDPVPSAGSPTPYENPANSNGNSGTDTDAGFQPRTNGNRAPAPNTPDPSADNGETYIPPTVTNPSPGPEAGSGGTTPVPPVTPPETPARKRPNLGDDEMGGPVGPRLEMEQKVTFRQVVARERQMPTVARVSATANRHGMFPKMAWRTNVETELAKK